MSGISTHILDTSLGRPAVAMPVVLEQMIEGAWRELSSHMTDADGRVKQFLSDKGIVDAGTYRLTFNTQLYFDTHKAQGLYPLVQITFTVRDTAGHYHIPLLLTANGYSTYRGS